jgi:hypothetical protein
MLLTDGNPADAAVLRGYEEQILDIAATQGLDLQTKLDIAADQVEDELESWLATRDNTRRRGAPSISRVVVTPALRRWHAMQTLELFYRDAYYQDLNDRFKGKWSMYAELKNEARKTFLGRGVEMVARAVAIGPEARGGLGSGPFGPMDLLIAASWVDAAGVEGAAGSPTVLEMPQGSRAMARIDAEAPAGFRWNVYAGVLAADMHMQNTQPLLPGDVWVQTAELRTDSKAPRDGQGPDYVVVDDRRLQRG